MRALLIIHQADSGAGVFLDALHSAGVESEQWYPAEGQAPPADPRAYGAVLSFGGAVHPVQDAEHTWLTLEKRFLSQVLAAGVPSFGVCLGAQLIAEAVGTRTRRAPAPEIGWVEVRMTAEAAADPVFSSLPERFRALEWHSYEVPLPAGAVALAHSDGCLQAYRLGDGAWGIQFHAEVTRADFRHWLEIYDTDPDAVAIGLDVAAFGAQTWERIDAWNELGRGLCRRFLEVAGGLAVPAGPPPPAGTAGRSGSGGPAGTAGRSGSGGPAGTAGESGPGRPAGTAGESGPGRPAGTAGESGPGRPAGTAGHPAAAAG